MSINSKYHPSQIGPKGLIPNWPGASHFHDWHFVPFKFSGKPADLYFCLNGAKYSSSHELLIGIQFSDVGGDYLSPHIEMDNTLHRTYVVHRSNDVIAAYFIACDALDITPSISKE